MNPISWFEVPVIDMDRAVNFYNAVFGWDLQTMQAGPEFMAWFPMDEKNYGAGGILVQNKEYEPRDNGVLVYFGCADLGSTISKVPGAGGTILQDKKLISPEVGYMGLALDTEGNRIAFYERITKE